MFTYNSFNMWIKRQKIPLTRTTSHFVLGDLRKFAEQYGDIIQWDHGDIIQWDQSNRAHVLTHGVSGVEWVHYRHPLPEYCMMCICAIGNKFNSPNSKTSLKCVCYLRRLKTIEVKSGALMLNSLWLSCVAVSVELRRIFK
jgi:hypothetical protein